MLCCSAFPLPDAVKSQRRFVAIALFVIAVLSGFPLLAMADTSVFHAASGGYAYTSPDGGYTEDSCTQTSPILAQCSVSVSGFNGSASAYAESGFGGGMIAYAYANASACCAYPFWEPGAGAEASFSVTLTIQGYTGSTGLLEFTSAVGTGNYGTAYLDFGLQSVGFPNLTCPGFAGWGDMYSFTYGAPFTVKGFASVGATGDTGDGAGADLSTICVFDQQGNSLAQFNSAPDALGNFFVPTPEPSTLTLLAAGLIPAVRAIRRKYARTSAR